MAYIQAPECRGCGLCVQFCPHGAITMSGRLAVIDANLCTGCDVCVGRCPVHAIKSGDRDSLAASGRSAATGLPAGSVPDWQGPGHGMGQGLGRGHGGGMGQGLGRGHGGGMGGGMGQGPGRGGQGKGGR